jgi:hypothetical protein
MTTRATISTVIDDQIHGIRVSNDGHEDELGQTLELCYNDYDHVVQLIEQGLASYIGDVLEHSEFLADVYDVEPEIFVEPSITRFTKIHGEQFNYHFDPEIGEWDLV